MTAAEFMDLSKSPHKNRSTPESNLIPADNTTKGGNKVALENPKYRQMGGHKPPTAINRWL